MLPIMIHFFFFFNCVRICPLYGSSIAYVKVVLITLQLSALLADVGLNIREAHVFSTTSGYSLDVFVVDGWPSEV